MIKIVSCFLLLALSFHGIASAQENNGKSAFFGVSDGRDPAASVIHDSTFYGDKERGWFWYEEPISDDEPVEDVAPPPEPPPPKEIKAEQPPAKPAEAKPLSAEWFRKNMEKYRDKAIDEPTPENVSAYMYLQRVVLDKSEKFAQVTQQVVMSDPVLDETQGALPQPSAPLRWTTWQPREPKMRLKNSQKAQGFGFFTLVPVSFVSKRSVF